MQHPYLLLWTVSSIWRVVFFGACALHQWHMYLHWSLMRVAFKIYECPVKTIGIRAFWMSTNTCKNLSVPIMIKVLGQRSSKFLLGVRVWMVRCLICFWPYDELVTGSGVPCVCLIWINFHAKEKWVKKIEGLMGGCLKVRFILRNQPISMNFKNSGKKCCQTSTRIMQGACRLIQK